MNMPSNITNSGIQSDSRLFVNTGGVASLYLPFRAFVVFDFCPFSGDPSLDASARGRGMYCSAIEYVCCPKRGRMAWSRLCGQMEK